VATEDGPPWPRPVAVELIQDISGISSPTEGFLRRLRHRVKTVFSDDTRTDTYVVDYIDRDPSRRDAIGVAVYSLDPEASVEETRVLLRRQVRYAAYQITGQALTTELIAGLIEGGERPEQTTVRELLEEAGLTIQERDVRSLGPPFFVVPGTMTERMFPVAVQVSAEMLETARFVPPGGDGSPFEEGAEHEIVTLAEAFARIDRGPGAEPYLADAKTELILGRLWRTLEGAR
jgi:ADP-ribose pyrophosphatase